MTTLSRRTLFVAGTVSGDHPLNISIAKARDRILQETDGKVLIEIFPINQLGSDAGHARPALIWST
jgi:TRAP-type C4-dicarboxylate transport system substrate-binding protein